MDCYSIALPLEPEILFAFSVKSNRYSMHINDRTDVIEIILNLGDPIQAVLDGKTDFIPKGNLFCLMPGMNYFGTLVGHTLYTLDIAVKCRSSLQYKTNSNAESLQITGQQNCMILPMMMDVSSAISRFSSLFNTVILQNMENSAIGSLRALSSLYELLSVIMETYHCLNFGISARNYPVGHYYGAKVKALLDENPTRPISVKKLADSMNITPNYLCAVFRKAYIVTISEYRNRLRMRYVRERLNETNISESELAEEVGIGSIRYLQRLFKSVYGMSIQECKLIDREVSLHSLQKPWEDDIIYERQIL